MHTAFRYLLVLGAASGTTRRESNKARPAVCVSRVAGLEVDGGRHDRARSRFEFTYMHAFEPPTKKSEARRSTPRAGE